MPFTPVEFHELVDSDVWVVDQMLTLPSDPPAKITKKNGETHIEIFDTVAMPQMQEAVREFRRRLLPATFMVAQKVYAELFRVVLGAAGHSAGNRQVDVENRLGPMIASSSLSIVHPFSDHAHLVSWWSGKYDYQRLRLARNRVVHADYMIAGGRITVTDDAGVVLLDWSEGDTLEFASEVVRIARRT